MIMMRVTASRACTEMRTGKKSKKKQIKNKKDYGHKNKIKNKKRKTQKVGEPFDDKNFSFLIYIWTYSLY